MRYQAALRTDLGCLRGNGRYLFRHRENIFGIYNFVIACAAIVFAVLNNPAKHAASLFNQSFRQDTHIGQRNKDSRHDQPKTEIQIMENTTAPRVIQSAAAAMYGVSLMADGHMENIGIGSFDLDRSEEMACRLEAIAAAIRAKAEQRIKLVA